MFLWAPFELLIQYAPGFAGGDLTVYLLFAIL